MQQFDSVTWSEKTFVMSAQLQQLSLYFGSDWNLGTEHRSWKLPVTEIPFDSLHSPTTVFPRKNLFPGVHCPLNELPSASIQLADWTDATVAAKASHRMRIYITHIVFHWIYCVCRISRIQLRIQTYCITYWTNIQQHFFVNNSKSANVNLRGNI